MNYVKYMEYKINNVPVVIKCVDIGQDKCIVEGAGDFLTVAAALKKNMVTTKIECKCYGNGEVTRWEYTGKTKQSTIRRGAIGGLSFEIVGDWSGPPQ